MKIFFIDLALAHAPQKPNALSSQGLFYPVADHSNGQRGTFMKITLKSTQEELGYIGTNERGQSTHFSGSKQSPSPMETVLMSAAACSAIDVELFLQKMRAPAEKVEVDVEGHRVDAVPAVFDKIHLHYRIYGDIPHSKAEKAVRMSMDQYCSVSIMLKKAAEITHTFEVLTLQSQS